MNTEPALAEFEEAVVFLSKFEADDFRTSMDQEVLSIVADSCLSWDSRLLNEDQNMSL